MTCVDDNNCDYHIVCGCQSIAGTVSLGDILKDYGISNQTLLYPVSSKIMEYLDIPNTLNHQCFHRVQDPLGETSFNRYATNDALHKWINSLYSDNDIQIIFQNL